MEIHLINVIRNITSKLEEKNKKRVLLEAAFIKGHRSRYWELRIINYVIS